VSDPAREARVLVVAPTGRDAAMVTDVLTRAGVAAEACAGIEDLCRRWADGAGAAFVAEEALTPEALACLTAAAAAQPPWSDLPIVVMTGGGKTTRFTTRVAAALEQRSKVTLLERPLRQLTLISSVRAALAARRRQYEVRDLLQAAREAVLRRDQFLAMLAHELRNPLAPVRNAVQILRMGGVGTESAAATLDLMERQVQHMARLLDDLLDVSRVTHNKITLRKEDVEISAVVSRAVEATRHLMDARSHNLLTEVAPGPHCIYGDVTRLVQVVSNLLNNAAKYTPEGGRITLAVGRDRNDVVLRVRDNGVGISPDLLPHIFDLFSQGRRSLARSEGGLGIGLALVKTLTEMHGGTIGAHSDGPEKGSEFEVRLPLATAHERAAEDGGPPTNAEEATPRSVLVVDDNRDAADSLARVLRMAGHAAEVAYDGPSAVAAALRLRPDVVVLDIGLPGMSGYEVAERLRQSPEAAGTRLVALSGYGQPEDREKSFAAGCDHHFVKPVNLARLLAVIGEDVRPERRPL
jgi:signal transduction histidine kinase/ActR/RegA family two-component response regulator